MAETFSKSSSEQVPSDRRHCRLTSDIFAEEFFTCRHWIYCRYISRNTDSQKLSIDMITVWRLVEDKLLNMFLRSELNECRSKEESKSELKVMLEIDSCRNF